MLLKAQNVRSSLPLEILLRINAKLSFVFFFVFLGLHLFKNTYLHIPKHADVSEIIIILMFGPLEALRIEWARRGNLTETSSFVSFSILLGLAVLAVCVYIGLFQNYVMLAELIMACTEAGLVLLETLFSVAAVASFSRGASSS